MFSTNLGDELLANEPQDTQVQGSVTRNSRTGELFIKLVNPQLGAEKLRIQLKGSPSVASKGVAITLSGNPEESNSITEPAKIVPITQKMRGLASEFMYEMPPHSIVVLRVKP
jgi:alpha-N-arabinofuranosidase